MPTKKSGLNPLNKILNIFPQSISEFEFENNIS